MKRIGILVCCLVTVLNLRAEPADQKPAIPLSVRIVPESFREKGGRSITFWQPAQHFHVVITNPCDKPVRLWRDWCSWGEQMLSFEVTDENGKAIVVKKTPRNYRKNYPDWTLLLPGDHMVFDVFFDQTTWTNAPLPEKGNSREVKMKAVFEIPEDKETMENKVWTGKVCSPEETYTIYR